MNGEHANAVVSPLLALACYIRASFVRELKSSPSKPHVCVRSECSRVSLDTILV